MVIVKAPVFFGLFFDHMFFKESGLCAAAAFIPPHLARDIPYLISYSIFGKEVSFFFISSLAWFPPGLASVIVNSSIYF